MYEGLVVMKPKIRIVVPGVHPMTGLPTKEAHEVSVEEAEEIRKSITRQFEAMRVRCHLCGARTSPERCAGCGAVDP